jgi:S-(hydroxymethyl)glutathione dehydrogenase/alcohol dehydrogenase
MKTKNISKNRRPTARFRLKAMQCRANSARTALSPRRWKRLRARRIIAVDLLDSKLETARHFGATHTVNASKADPVKEIKALSDGGVDYSFDAIGNRQVLEQCFYCLAPRGFCTLVGAIPTGQKIELMAGHFYIEKQLRGCFMGSNRFHIDMPRYLDLYRQGRLNLDDMVSRHGRLEDVNEAFRAMEAGEVTRTVLTFD